MVINSAIFDLDGTIATFNLDYKALRAEVRGYLMKTGVPASLLEVNESIFEMLKKTELRMNNAGKSSIAIEQVRRGVLNIAEKHELEAAALTSLLPGVLDTLKSLKRDKIKIGLCTLNGEKATTFILNRFKIGDYFDSIITREKVNSTKPHPEHFVTVLKAISADASETVIVGDSISDMQGAKELKSIAIGLPTGVSSKDDLVSHGANYIMTSIIDLPILIKRINKPQHLKHIIDT